MLKRIKKELYHFNDDGEKVIGPHPGLYGDITDHVEEETSC